MGQIIQSAFSDAWPLLATRKIAYIVLIVLAAAGGFYGATLPKSFTATGSVFGQPIGNLYYSNGQASLGIAVIIWLGLIAAFFAFPAAARTVNASFGMTVGRFFALIGIVLVVGLVASAGTGILYGLGFALMIKGSAGATVGAMFCFLLAIVFAFFISIKWSQVAWAYVLAEPPNPFAASWRSTTGQFWQTFLFSILLGIVIVIPLYIVGGIAIWIAIIVPLLGIITIPIGLLAFIFVLNVQYLAQVRWFVHLRERARVGIGISA